MIEAFTSRRYWKSVLYTFPSYIAVVVVIILCKLPFWASLLLSLAMVYMQIIASVLARETKLDSKAPVQSVSDAVGQ